MLSVFVYIFALLVIGILTYFAFRYNTVFLYLYLLGLPFDNVALSLGILHVSVADAALVLLLISWVIDFFFKSRGAIRFPFQVYTAFMLMLFIVGANLINDVPPDSYKSSFSFMVKIVGFILLLQLVRNEAQLNTTIKILILGAVLSGFLAVYQQYAFITGGMPKLRTVMVEGTRAGLNNIFPFAPLRVPSGMNREAAYGVYLSFVISLLLGFYVFRFPFKVRAAALLPLILLLAVMIMNDTRAAYFGILVTMIIAIILSNTNAKYLILLIIAFLPLLMLPMYEFLFHHRETSVIQRQQILIPIFEYAMAHPLGGGIFDFVRSSEQEIGAHSSLLQVLVHGGIPALICYSLLLLTAARRLYTNLKYMLKVKYSNPVKYGLFGVITASFFGMIIQSEFIHPRAMNKDHWAFFSIIFLSTFIVDTVKSDDNKPQSAEPETQLPTHLPQMLANGNSIQER